MDSVTHGRYGRWGEHLDRKLLVVVRKALTAKIASYGMYTVGSRTAA